MCSASTPHCGYNNSTIFLIGVVYFPNTKCLGKLCLHKKTFQSLGRNDYQCPQCASVCKVRNNPFEDQTNSFFLSFGPGVYVFEEIPKTIQDVNGNVYCPGKYCLNREKCESIGGYVTTPRSTYGCAKCGVWLFVHKFPFTSQRHVKTTKTGKSCFFLLKKMLPDKQLIINVPFRSSKYGKKELRVDNKVKETIGDVYCPTCRNEKCVYISTNRMNSFFDCKKCKACCHVLNNPFKDQKPTNMLFGGDETQCFARKKSRDFEKEKLFLFFEEISPPITTKHIRTWTKKGWKESKYGISVSVSYWLMIWAINSNFKSFYSFWI